MVVEQASWTARSRRGDGQHNADLLATALDRPDRSVLAARHQTAGKGRLDRRWDAPPGANLLASFLFRDVPDDPGELMRRVALAAADACATVAGVEVTLKWPNDLMVGERKLAGILAERHQDGPVVVGLGLNVGWAPDGAARLGDGIDPLDVLRAVLAAYDALPGDIGQRYRDAMSTIGRTRPRRASRRRARRCRHRRRARRPARRRRRVRSHPPAGRR